MRVSENRVMAQRGRVAQGAKESGDRVAVPVGKGMPQGRHWGSSVKQNQTSSTHAPRKALASENETVLRSRYQPATFSLA